MAFLGSYELADHNFPDRIQQHRLEFLGVDALEEAGAALIRQGFPAIATLRFLRQVCRWGGYYGIAARVSGDNQTEDIRQALISAAGHLAQNDVVGALEAINDLRGLGRPSFASKFLRFLAPQSAAILDSVISRQADIPLSLHGYNELIKTCRGTAAHLAEGGVMNPVRENGVWYVADIEAAFYADMESLQA